MSSINFMGSYSGITMETVDQLIEAESGKLVQYTNQQTELKSEKSAWKDINTRLDALYKKFDALKEIGTFESKTVNNSNETAVSVSADTEAIEGTYNIEVTRLATSSQLTSGTIEAMTIDNKTSADSLNLKGDLTLSTTGSESFTIKVTEEDSLKEIVNKINETAKEKESGLQATIIDNRIVLMDSNMGKHSITVESDSTIASDLALDSTNGTFAEGQAAEFKINGISITRDSNNITDAVDGLTIELKAVTENNKVSTIKVAEDLDKTTEAVQGFVDQYNSVMDFIGTQLDVGDPSAEGNKTGALVGDSSLMRLQSQLRSMMTSSSSGSDQAIRSLSDLGIEVDRYGKATLDSSKLKEVLAEDSNAVQNFFFREETVLSEEGVEETKEVGMSAQMTTFINEYIGEKTGIITTKAKTIDGMIENLDEQITRFNERLETKRTRYIEQFTALDVAMMEAESQLSYLMSQIGSATGNTQQM